MYRKFQMIIQDSFLQTSNVKFSSPTKPPNQLTIALRNAINAMKAIKFATMFPISITP